VKYFVGAVNFHEKNVASELVRRYIRESGLQHGIVRGDEFFSSVSPRLNGPASQIDAHLILHCEPFIKVSFSLQAQKSLGFRLSEDASIEGSLVTLYRKHYQNWPAMLCSEHVTAVWDPINKRLLMSRDRFGTKSLYYSFVGKTFVFSNRLACVFAFPGVSQELSTDAALDFLLFGKHNNFESELTPFRAIKAVLPGHVLLKSTTDCRVIRYWNFPTSTPVHHHQTSKDTLDKFSSLLHKAVSRRVGSGKLLVALSGGVDSTTTAAVALNVDNSFRGRTAAFTVADSDQNEEHIYAAKVAKKLGLPHERFDDSDYSLFECKTPCLIPTENPFPQKYVDLQFFTSSRADTVLTAGAADNLIVWSDVYLAREFRVAGLFHAIRSAFYYKKMFGKRIPWRSSRARSKGVPTYALPDWVRQNSGCAGTVIDRWDEFWGRMPGQAHVRHPQVHSAMICVNWDRDLGLVDFEVDSGNRMDPFFDEDLIDFVLSLPALPWFYKKRLMKGVGFRYLPPEVLQRKKSPAKDLVAGALQLADLESLNRVSGDEFLNDLVDYTKWQPVYPHMAPSARYVNMRLIAFSRWLMGFRGFMK